MSLNYLLGEIIDHIVLGLMIVVGNFKMIDLIHNVSDAILYGADDKIVGKIYLFLIIIVSH